MTATLRGQENRKALSSAPQKTLWREAQPLSGADGRLRRPARPGRRRERRPDRRGLPRHPRVLPRAGPHHAAADRGEGVPGASRSRPTGPTPTASTATCAARPRTPTPRRRCAAFAASRPGCGATPRCSTSSAGCAPTTNGPEGRRTAGFYGLDLYSLYASIAEVIAYLERVDPPAAERARERYACFEHFGGEPDLWPRRQPRHQRVLPPRSHRPADRAAATRRRLPASRRDRRRGRAVLRRAERPPGRQRRGVLPLDVRRPGLIVEPARPPHGRHARPPPRTTSARHGEPARIVVWEHNSHVGDARLTEMSRRGELNVGQLARERWPDEVALVGFTTYAGTVTAASAWDAPAERKRVRPALARELRGDLPRRRRAPLPPRPA